jgi:hypothetical protein
MENPQDQEDKIKLLMKFFDYTEAPIKEWIAEYLNQPVDKVFPDYEDKVDLFGFQDDNTKLFYSGYVVSMEQDQGPFVDKQLIESSEKVKQVCSLLFDAVAQVFNSVIATCDDSYKESVKDLRPMFNEEKLAFYLVRINSKAAELQMAVEHKKKLFEMLHADNTEEQNQKIYDFVKKLDLVIEKHTKAELDLEEIKCQLINSKMSETKWLYLAIDQGEEANLSRLPEFGLLYQDPEEDNYIDKLKKENNVQ